MKIELKSPSYTAQDIEKWVNDNPENEIAQRIKKKYFGGAKFRGSSKYFVVFTSSGGVVLKKDKSIVRAS